MLFFQKFNKFNGNFSSSSLHHHCRIFLENLPGVSSEVPPRAPSEISSGFYWEFFRDLKWDLLRCSIGIPPEVPKKFLKNPREVLWRIPVKVSLDFFSGWSFELSFGSLSRSSFGYYLMISLEESNFTRI